MPDFLFCRLVANICCSLVYVDYAVYNSSKVKSLKAIHNIEANNPCLSSAVYNSSKVKSLKAIHNAIAFGVVPVLAVYNSSKVKSLKAIHNSIVCDWSVYMLSTIVQR